MKKPIFPFLLFASLLVSSQAQNSISYQEALDICAHRQEEQHNKNPDLFPYVGPDCIIGANVPVFTATTMDGSVITEDYFQGKITILNFWMISCPPCIAEIPGFNHIRETYGHDQLHYVAITPDNEKDVKHFLSNNPWTFEQVLSGFDIIFDIFHSRWGFPTTLVINQQGVIIDAFSGGRTDENAIKDLEDRLTVCIQNALK